MHNNAVFHFQENAFTIWLTVVFGVHKKAQLIFVVAPDGGTVPVSVSGVVFDQGLDNLLSGHAFLDLVVEAAICLESWINDPGIESEEKEDRRDEDSTTGEDEQDAGPFVFPNSKYEKEEGDKDSEEAEIGELGTKRSFHLDRSLLFRQVVFAEDYLTGGLNYLVFLLTSSIDFSARRFPKVS